MIGFPNTEWLIAHFLYLRTMQPSHYYLSIHPGAGFQMVFPFSNQFFAQKWVSLYLASVFLDCVSQGPWQEPNSSNFRNKFESIGDIPQLFGDIPRLCSDIPAVFSKSFNVDTRKALLVCEKASACMQLRNEQSDLDETEKTKHCVLTY